MVGDLAQRIDYHLHDSALGRWIEARCAPPPDLADAVEAIFYGEGSVTYRRDRILPSGMSHLLINLGPTQYLVSGDEERQSFTDLWFSGQQDAYLETEAPHGTTILGVVFRPYGAYAVMGFDQDCLRGRVVSLAELLGDRVARLRQRLLDTSDVVERIAVAEGWLRQQAMRGRQVHPATKWAVEQIVASAGQLRIRDLAGGAGYSSKHLVSLLRREVGLSAKSLARITRFHAVLTRLRHDQEVDWSALAADCGYYDQSHLTRDIRCFAGCRPGDLLSTPAADENTLAMT